MLQRWSEHGLRYDFVISLNIFILGPVPAFTYVTHHVPVSIGSKQGSISLTTNGTFFKVVSGDFSLE